jgi:hypothetical protein
MIRHLLTLGFMAFVVTVVGGQSPKALEPKERAELYKKNRVVIESLVEKTVASSRTPNDHVKRAETYYQVLLQFNKEIRAANSAGDKPRVDELTKHLSLLLDQGLSATLRQARLQVEGGSGEEEYKKVRDDLLAQFKDLYQVLSDRPESQKSLDDATARLGEITGPKKK